jgi:hypothetical protein
MLEAAKRLHFSVRNGNESVLDIGTFFPAEARIPIIAASMPTDPAQVRARYTRLKPIREDRTPNLLLMRYALANAA